MNKRPLPETAAPTEADRRRSPRIEILGRVQGHLTSLDTPVGVLDISLGGMALETSFAFEVGSRHEFRLALGDGSYVLLRGEIRHCRRVAPADRDEHFITGVQFVEEPPSAGDTTVAGIIDEID
jgi:hypothetical protein